MSDKNIYNVFDQPEPFEILFKHNLNGYNINKLLETVNLSMFGFYLIINKINNILNNKFISDVEYLNNKYLLQNLIIVKLYRFFDKCNKALYGNQSSCEISSFDDIYKYYLNVNSDYSNSPNKFLIFLSASSITLLWFGNNSRGTI